MQTRKYFKVFHYSHRCQLDEIDPAFYGTRVSGHSELRKGSAGIKKSFYYTIDDPEFLVRTHYRYEIYLSAKWKEKIYDYFDDPKKFRAAAKSKVEQALAELPYRTDPTEYQIQEAYEKIIFDHGFVGLRYKSSEDLSDVHNRTITLFRKKRTGKPNGLYVACDYETGKPIEISRAPVERNLVRENFIGILGLFKSPEKHKEEIKEFDKKNQFSFN